MTPLLVKYCEVGLSSAASIQYVMPTCSTFLIQLKPIQSMVVRSPMVTSSVLLTAYLARLSRVMSWQ